MLEPGTVIDSYRILAPLGAGGMGEVYRARDTGLGRDVALKVIRSDLARDPERIERFEREARAAGVLSHPNVCAVFGIGSHEGSPYVVMELLRGESLRARLRHGPVPPRKAIDWVVQAAHGVAAAHEKGIVHRDLKPENLVLTADGCVKVLDFGLAKLTRPEAAAGADTTSLSVAPTALGTILGTAAYMAPEQVRGEAADHRADLFALGAILYELLTGQRAFGGTALPEITYRILHEEPPPLDDCGRAFPPALEGIVRHCLEKQPAERFQSALDLAFALASAEPDPASGPARSRRRRLPRALVTVAIAAAVLGLGYLAGRGARHPPAVAPRVPDYQRLKVDRGRVLSARFVGDTGSIAYAAAWGGRPVELYEIRPGFTASRAIGLAKANLLSVTRGGTMAVALDQEPFTGWAQPGTLAEVSLPGGEPRRLLDHVLSGDWAPDGRTLAVSHLVQGKTRLELPPGNAIYESGGRLGWVRVAPSGEYVAFVENPVPPDTRGSVVMVDRNGRVLARTVEWNSVLGVAWSRDGREAWYTASQDGAASDLGALTPAGAQRVVQRFPGYMVLHDIAPDGRLLLAREHVVCGIRGRASPRDEERELGWLDWSTAYDISRDGRTLLFDEQGLGGGRYYTVWLRGLDGSAPVRLGEGHGCSLSPDGRTVLVAHFGEPNRLLLMPTGPGSAVELPRGSIDRYQRAQWLPDGRGFVIVAAEPGRARRTWLQDAGGGPPSPVTPEGIFGAAVSPDGRFVAATDQEEQLYVCPLAGGAPTAVTQLEPEDIVVGWSPDGRSIIVGEKGTAMTLSRIHLPSGPREAFGRFAPPDPAGTCVWNAHLTPAGGAYAYSYFRWVDELYLVDGLD